MSTIFARNGIYYYKNSHTRFSLKTRDRSIAKKLQRNFLEDYWFIENYHLCLMRKLFLKLWREHIPAGYYDTPCDTEWKDDYLPKLDRYIELIDYEHRKCGCD